MEATPAEASGPPAPADAPAEDPVEPPEDPEAAAGAAFREAAGTAEPADATGRAADGALAVRDGPPLAGAMALVKGGIAEAVGRAPPEPEDSCQPGPPLKPGLGAEAPAEAARPVEPAAVSSASAGGPPAAPPSFECERRDAASRLNAGAGASITGPASAPDVGPTPADA